jgi:TRAP-type C4-dicarboxylate transport system permease small subunit
LNLAARNFLYSISRLLTWIRWLVAGLVILFFTYMTLAVLVQVGGRYLFDYAIDWTAESATFAQIWMIFLAAGLAMRDRLHVSVDMLTDIVPATVRRLFIVIIAAACVWFLWQAIQGSLELIDIGRIQSSPVLQVPMWIPYLSLPVGLMYFGLELLLALAARWRAPIADAGSP